MSTRDILCTVCCTLFLLKSTDTNPWVHFRVFPRLLMAVLYLVITSLETRGGGCLKEAYSFIPQSLVCVSGLKPHDFTCKAPPSIFHLKITQLRSSFTRNAVSLWIVWWTKHTLNPSIFTYGLMVQNSSMHCAFCFM